MYNECMIELIGLSSAPGRSRRLMLLRHIQVESGCTQVSNVKDNADNGYLWFYVVKKGLVTCSAAIGPTGGAIRSTGVMTELVTG